MKAPATSFALTVFQGRAGDRNPLAMRAAPRLGAAWAARTGLTPVRVGEPQPPLAGSWEVELPAARAGLSALAARCDAVLSAGAVPLTVMGRCATALATLPVAVRHHPEACVVWFDAHADCNTPQSSTSGYLGGLVLSGTAGLWDSGLGAGLDLKRLVLVGSRDIDPPEARLIASAGITLVGPGSNLAMRLASALQGRPAYVHFDCDVLEPGLVPTEYHVPGGLGWQDVREAFAVLAVNGIVGLEIAEFEDSFDPGGPPASAETLLDSLSAAWATARP